MISQILLETADEPTISVGGILDAIHSNVHVGDSDVFITEACEYTNSFLSFFPTVGIILNIEEDHLDFFKDLQDIRNSFHKFAKLIPEDGTLIINGEISEYREITKGLPCRVITYSTHPDCSDGQKANYFAEEIDLNGMHPSFVLNGTAGQKRRIRLSVPGLHNVSNSLAAIACADILGIDPEVTDLALDNFTGTDRRFELKGIKNGVTIIDDYAHHPTEITATLTAAQKFPHKTLWCVFQPHTYTRTKALMKDFAKALSLADKVVLAEIYPARETDTLGISSENLREEIAALGVDCLCFPDFREIEKFLSENCIKDDVLITMGAGNVYEIGEDLLKS